VHRFKLPSETLVYLAWAAESSRSISSSRKMRVFSPGPYGVSAYDTKFELISAGTQTQFMCASGGESWTSNSTKRRRSMPRPGQRAAAQDEMTAERIKTRSPYATLMSDSISSRTRRIRSSRKCRTIRCCLVYMFVCETVN